jgi:hypothetical protein
MVQIRPSENRLTSGYGKVHPWAKTTFQKRAKIRASEASVGNLANQFGLNPKTVAKWKNRFAGFAYGTKERPAKRFVTGRRN